MEQLNRQIEFATASVLQMSIHCYSIILNHRLYFCTWKKGANIFCTQRLQMRLNNDDNYMEGISCSSTDFVETPTKIRRKFKIFFLEEYFYFFLEENLMKGHSKLWLFINSVFQNHWKFLINSPNLKSADTSMPKNWL